MALSFLHTPTHTPQFNAYLIALSLPIHTSENGGPSTVFYNDFVNVCLAKVFCLQVCDTKKKQITDTNPSVNPSFLYFPRTTPLSYKRCRY